ncbi:MAG: hypothetical protein NVSMB9_12800 [Isosphaeraceae bacterium]
MLHKVQGNPSAYYNGGYFCGRTSGLKVDDDGYLNGSCDRVDQEDAGRRNGDRLQLLVPGVRTLLVPS